MALTSASSRASLMAKMSCSATGTWRRACSISAWTRRASTRSLGMTISRGRQGTGGLMGPVLGRPVNPHPPPRVGVGASERLQTVLLTLVDGEQLVQLGDLEHLV